MKVIYIAYIDRKSGPFFHAKGFISAFTKLVEKLIVIGLKDTDKVLNYNRPKTLKLIKKFQPHITWDLKLIIINIIRLYREHKIIKREKPSLIILRYELYTFSAAFWAWLFKIPLIIEANGSPAYECNKFGMKGNYQLARCFENKILDSAKAIIVISTELKKFFIHARNISEKKIYVNPNGVDLHRFNPNTTNTAKKHLNLSDHFVIGYVGTFSPRHDITTLIEAATIAVSKISEAIFLLVGDGMLSSDIRRLVNEYSLKDHIKFIGRVGHNDIPLYIAAMDTAVTLFPPTLNNQFHGSPVKIFEYMAMKKAIITTKIGQLKEIFTDGYNGFLVDQEDEEGVAKRILEIYSDEQLKKRLGENAYKTLIEKGFTWEDNAKRVFEVCQKVLQ